MRIFVLISLVFAASSAYAEIFTWVDSKGISHYTNKAYDIPHNYRNKAKSLYQDPAKTDVQSQTSSTPAQALPTGTPQNTTVVPAPNQSAGSTQPNTPMPVPPLADQAPQQKPSSANSLKQDLPGQLPGEKTQPRMIRPRSSRMSTED